MGHIAVTCPICQHVGFNAARDAPAPTDVVSCASCGLKLSYGFLLRKLTPASDDRKVPAPTAVVRKVAAARKPPIKRKLHKAKRKKRRAA